MWPRLIFSHLELGGTMEDVKLSIYFHFQLKSWDFSIYGFDHNYCQHIISEVQEKGKLGIKLDGIVIVHHATGEMYL